MSVGMVQAQIDIADAITMSEGSVVTLRGIATNGEELGIIRYMQDATGGIAVYPAALDGFTDDVNRGTDFEVTGELKIYNGLLELDPITSYTVFSNGNDLPAPIEGDPTLVNEENESKLLKINGVKFDASGDFAVGTYSFTSVSTGESAQIYVRAGHPLVENGVQIPLATVNLTGISSQFNSYQMLLRDEADIEIADDFYLTSPPAQSDITTGGFTINFETNAPGSTGIRYGLTPDLGEEMEIESLTTDHEISLTGLDAAECYYVQVFSTGENSEATSQIALYSTASNSTGQVHVYFNAGIDASFSNGSFPVGITGAAMEEVIIHRINSATTSIDVALYNINRETIVAALTNAHNNGIQVRYIADDQTQNIALENPTPPFPIVYGNGGDPLMHNKFLVFDADSQNDSWIIMGSTNTTSNNLSTDYNNLVLIQDEAIAKAYTTEFIEMWGADTPTPGIFNTKFGENKTDNTPHLFNVNGMMVESYFSPSDNTTAAIANAIGTADTDLEFQLLSFTMNQLGDAVVDAFNAGVEVRGIINNINDTGSEFAYLEGLGVNVSEDNTTIQTHHKYAIIDGSDPGSDPQVITGSHNWSNGAETRNDENTLIFHDADIANIFIMEFEARWCEATGGSSCTTANEELNIAGFEASIFPCPAQNEATIQMNLEQPQNVVISLWDMAGRRIKSSVHKNLQGEVNIPLLLKGLDTGNYIVTFNVDKDIAVRKLEVIK